MVSDNPISSQVFGAFLDAGAQVRGGALWQGIITYLLLVRAGFSERTSLWAAFCAAAVTTPLGMLVSWPLINRIGPATLGGLLALSAGALIYVGATHLLPRAEQELKQFSLVALAGGVLVAVIIVLSKQ